MSDYAGLDLGGTAIKHGVVDRTGAVLAQGATATPPGGRDAILQTLAGIVQEYCRAFTLEAVGLGTAGAVDFESGTILGHSPNIAGWGNTPVRAELHRRLRLPVAVDNDANCMALAELHAGAGQGCRSLFFLTLGTGIGSAVVNDGKLWRGAHSLGGEWGHATIVHDGRPCACGQRGHLEAYASATALVARARELAGRDDPEPADARGVFAAAESGDRAARQAVAETVAYLASGIASAVNLLDPERVILGGGMADAGDEFLNAVETQTRARVHVGLAEHLKIVPAVLGNRAGFIGAALLARTDAGAGPT